MVVITANCDVQYEIFKLFIYMLHWRVPNMSLSTSIILNELLRFQG